LERELRHAAEHLRHVDLLPTFAVHVAPHDLPDEQNHRRVVLPRRMHADRACEAPGPRVT